MDHTKHSDGFSELNHDTITTFTGETLKDSVHKSIPTNSSPFNTSEIAEESHTPPDSPHGHSVSNTELAFYVTKKWGFLYIKAAIAGLLIGVFMTGFKYFSAKLNELRYMAAEAAAPHCAHWVMCGIMSTVYIIIAGLVAHMAPMAAGSGIPLVAKSVEHGLKLHSFRTLPAKFVAACLTMGSRTAVGPEGPAIHISGMAADIITIIFPTSVHGREAIIASAAGCGFGCAFDAPAASVLFLLEDMREVTEISFQAASCSLLMTYASIFVLHQCLPTTSVFPIPQDLPQPPLNASLIYVFVGVFGGLIGGYFAYLIQSGVRFWKSRPWWYRYISQIIMAFYLGALSWKYPYIVGEGENTVNGLFTPESGVGNGFFILIVRMAHIVISYTLTVLPGGLLAPMLSLGAPTGLLFGLLLHRISPRLAPYPQMICMDGMIAFFSTVVQANLTGIVLILELTNYWDGLLRLLFVSFGSFMVAHAIKSKSITAP